MSNWVQEHLDYIGRIASLEAELARAREELKLAKIEHSEAVTKYNRFKEWSDTQMDASLEAAAVMEKRLTESQAQVERLRQLLAESQEYAQHQRRDCQELSECVCGYQSWWDRTEAALESEKGKT